MKKTRSKIILVLLSILILAIALIFTACCGKPVSYTIAYNLDGGTNHPDNPAEYTSESALITLKNPTKDGYLFLYWQEGNTIPTGSTGNKPFTAVWSKTYNINYVLDGGINHPDNPDKYTAESVPITLKNPTKDGYAFVRWQEGGTINAGGMEDKTFTAVWATAGLAFIPVEGGYSIFKGTANTNGTVVIPAEYNSLPVIEIGYKAFFGCGGMTNITIPDSVTTIGSQAFYECASLTSITIPDSVTTIESGAFYGCASLANITIPDSMINIGDNAFRNTAWYNNKSDGLVYIGKVLYVYKGTMLNGTKINDIRSDTLAIASAAFSGYIGLTSITIPNSVTTIGSQAFYNCIGLTSITIPNSVTTIGDYTFYGCTDLTSITIPNSVTTIGSWAFNRCFGLTSITIPNNVTTIGNYAFYGCADLTSITIPNSVTTIGDGTFGGCTSLTSITIPNSVTTIGSRAFYWCTGLTSITIPNSVTTIEDQVFSGCNALTSITVSSGNTVYKNDGNCLIQKADNVLIMGCKNSVIPNYVTGIADYAFYECIGLTNITIPNSVTTIGDYAFRGTSITSITVPNSVTTVGNSAFGDYYKPTLYTEATSKPSDWSSWYNSNHPVVWGCTLSSDKTYVESFTKTSASITNLNAENCITAPYREGYTFKEWNTKTNGSGTAYAAANINTVANGTILYAIWIEN